MAETKLLPSVTKLAEDSWELFKKTWTDYLKLVGLTIAYVFLALLIGVLIILPVSFIAFGSHFQLFDQPTPFTIIIMILLTVWLVLFFLSLVVIEILFPIASVFILQEKKNSSLFDLIKATKPYFWPYFLTVLLSGFLVAGSAVLLLIPGLLIAFFFSFVLFEVVIDGQKGGSALKRSYFMVKNNFWQVFIRVVVLEVAVIILTSIANRIAGKDVVLKLVQFFFSLFASWYARAYIYLLFKEVRARTSFPAKISINWIWVVSVIGWVIVILLIVAGASGFMHQPVHPLHNPIHGNAV